MNASARSTWRGTLVPIAAMLVLSSCNTALDERRADLCRRAVPALVAKDVVPDIQRVGRGSTSDVVRVDFRTTGPSDTGTKPHWLLCRFEPDSLVLNGATTDGGPVSGASLYLLRHYYLDEGTDTGSSADKRP